MLLVSLQLHCINHALTLAAVSSGSALTRERSQQHADGLVLCNDAMNTQPRAEKEIKMRSRHQTEKQKKVH